MQGDLRFGVAAAGGRSFTWIEAPEVFGRRVADWVSAEYRQVGGLAIARRGTHGAGNETGGGPARWS